MKRLKAVPVGRLETTCVAAINSPAAIIAMGRQLGLKIVAEGVETREQLEFLATHGCTLAQGFYIGRPMRGDLVAEWIGRYVATTTMRKMPIIGEWPGLARV